MIDPLNEALIRKEFEIMFGIDKWSRVRKYFSRNYIEPAFLGFKMGVIFKSKENNETKIQE